MSKLIVETERAEPRPTGGLPMGEMNRVLKRRGISMVLGAVLFAWASVLSVAGAVTVEMGTLAPRNSSYHQALKAMGQEWRQAPQGGVRLRVFPGGVIGGESQMVREMRIGGLQAALLTATGLAEIDETFGGFQSLPMMFKDFEELNHVRQELQPELEEQLAENGFVTLFWGHAGWVRFFSKKPFTTPEDLKGMKIFVSAGYPEQVKLMRRAGFNPVPLESTDIRSGLQTGMIDAVAVPPIFALTQRLYESAPYMLELNWSPLLGAAVIRQQTWERIPEEAKPALMEAATEAGRMMRAQAREEERAAVRAMKKRSLKVQEVTPEIGAKWESLTKALYPELQGTLISKELFQQVEGLVEQYRAMP